ncbi:MAG: aminotransferase class V-fold PLP-dependent enzyme [Planctomycetales bacterium]
MEKRSTDNDQLAIFGGQPAFPDGPPDWPVEDKDVLDALTSVWSDGDWGRYHGQRCERLIAELAAMHHQDSVLLCCSGTYAVEAALRGLGVGPGDEVILAGYDFPGNFRAIEIVGARPVLADIASDSWCLSLENLEQAAADAVKAVIVSHLHGSLAPIQEIVEWAKGRGVSVIEDACQVPGATIGKAVVGSFGDVSVLSFGGSKLLSAGRGGALLTSRQDIFQRAKIYGNRGNDAFPLSELQAAVLLPQLEKLAARNLQREKGARHLLAKTASLLEARYRDEEGVRSAFYKLAWIHSTAKDESPSREEFIAAMQAEGIAIDSGFRGFSGRSRRRCRHAGPLPNSQAAAKSAILLHHPILMSDTNSLDRVVAAIEKVLASLAN